MPFDETIVPNFYWTTEFWTVFNAVATFPDNDTFIFSPIRCVLGAALPSNCCEMLIHDRNSFDAENSEFSTRPNHNMFSRGEWQASGSFIFIKQHISKHVFILAIVSEKFHINSIYSLFEFVFYECQVSTHGRQRENGKHIGCSVNGESYGAIHNTQ